MKHRSTLSYSLAFAALLTALSATEAIATTTAPMPADKDRADCVKAVPGDMNKGDVVQATAPACIQREDALALQQPMLFMMIDKGRADSDAILDIVQTVTERQSQPTVYIAATPVQNTEVWRQASTEIVVNDKSALMANTARASATTGHSLSEEDHVFAYCASAQRTNGMAFTDGADPHEYAWCQGNNSSSNGARK